MIWAALAVVLAAVCLAAGRGMVYIRPGERGVLLTLGRATRVLGPGWHFKIPLVHQVIKVKAEDLKETLEKFGMGGEKG